MTENPRSMLNESVSALVDGENNDLDLQRVLNAMDQEGVEYERDIDERGVDERHEGEMDAQTISSCTRGAWARYQLIGDVLRNERHLEHVDCSIDLSGAIRDAIAEENAPKISRFNFTTITQGVGKTAVAAAVTFGVVFGVQQYSSPFQSEGVPHVADVEANGGKTTESSVHAGAVVPQGFELPPLRARTVSTNSLAPESSRARQVVAPLPQNRVVISNEEFQAQMNRLLFKHAEQVSTSGGMGVMPFTRVSGVSEEDKE